MPTAAPFRSPASAPVQLYFSQTRRQPQALLKLADAVGGGFVMEQSIVELISRQRQRVDALAHLAGRFLDEPMSSALTRLAARLCRLAATLSTPSSRLSEGRTRLEGQL